MIEAHYEFQDSRLVEGTLTLDDDVVHAYRNAISDAERHAIIAPLVLADVLSSEGLGAHTRNITFQVFNNPTGT